MYGYGTVNGVFPNSTAATTPITTPTELPALEALQTQWTTENGGSPVYFTQFSLGNRHVLALTNTGKLWAWGYNQYGRVGMGHAAAQDYPIGTNFVIYTATQPVGTAGKTYTMVSAQNDRSMALCSDGTVWTWGIAYRATAGSPTNTYTSPSGLSYTYSTTQDVTPTTVNNPTPKQEDFDVLPGGMNSAYPISLGYTVAPKITSITCGSYVDYAIDEYGRVWFWGYDYGYGFMTDGPLTGPVGKLTTFLTGATLFQSLGDGDTEDMSYPDPTIDVNSCNSTEVKGPVFNHVPYNVLERTFTNYTEYGQWSPFSQGLHPTVYDKKYDVTTYVRDNPTDSHEMYMDPNLMKTDYLLDSQGRRIIYVLMRDGGAGTAASPYTFCGNYYVADDSYTGPWCVNDANYTTLPPGITSVTSTPALKESEQGWIGLSKDITNNTIDFTGAARLKPLAFAVKVSSLDVATQVIDSSGDLYKTSLNGSGNIAWGWDVTPYENTNGNALSGAVTAGLNYTSPNNPAYNLYTATVPTGANAAYGNYQLSTRNYTSYTYNYTPTRSRRTSAAALVQRRGDEPELRL